MHNHLRAIAAVIALAAIAFVVVYRNHHHLRTCTGCGLPLHVHVANKPIQKGTPGDVIRTNASYYKLANLPRSQIETGAILDPSTLAGKVAVKDIQTGQQLTAAEFAAGSPGMPGPSMNERAVVIKLTSPKDIGSQITAGSHVDLSIATIRHGSNTNHRAVLRKLYGNMYVLSVSTNGGTVTLRASPQQAGRLVYVSGKANDRFVVRLHR
jgi:Flp pilus assembly protein CpaB